MPRKKISFTNAEGQTLLGLLEIPSQQSPTLVYALFAHCFTCGKDIAAASRISRALAEKGIAVLRFDFTGLGGSDGDFANTNFSSNVQDLLCAAQALTDRYQAPSLLIGHSLGGAAVLSAAHALPSVQAIATIGAPSTADHVKHLFTDSLGSLAQAGETEVTIGTRPFTIKKQLLDDLTTYVSPAHIGELKPALLIMHSPIDNVVSIDEAANIYQAAKHPKSFISLDQADHLLSRSEDAEYVAASLAAWGSRYLRITEQSQAKASAASSLNRGEVLVTELDDNFQRGLFTDSHQWRADEPENYGGANLGPTPYDLLLMSLGACTSMTIRMYAKRKGIPLDDVEVRLVHERIHANDCTECEDRHGKVERITRFVHFSGDLTEQQIQSLVRIADRCPVHQTLESAPVITTRLLKQRG